MGKSLFLFLAAIVLLAGYASASTVSRSFSSSTIAPSTDLTVTLAVTVTGSETFYAIDETFPSGWVMKNAGTGSTQQAGHIKWVVIQGAASTTYVYVLTSPSQVGTSTFSGTYMFEGMPVEAQIAGATQVTVSAGVCPNGQITSPCTCGGVSYSSGYCCNGQYSASTPCLNNCATGLISSSCLCGGVSYSSGYCCNGSHQTIACSACTADSNCSSGQKCCNSICSVPACTSSIDCATGYVCQNPGLCNAACVQATGCTADANCAAGQLCCSGLCKIPVCGAEKPCFGSNVCTNPDSCQAVCSYVALKTFSIEAPAFFVLNEEFTLIVKDSEGNPVENALAVYAGEEKNTGPDGKVTFTAKKSQFMVKIQKEGFKAASVKRMVKSTGSTPDPSSTDGSAAGEFSINVLDEVYVGKEFDILVQGPQGNPVEGAAVSYGSQTVQTDAEGNASLVGEENVFLIRAKAGDSTASAKVLPKKPVVETGGQDTNATNGGLPAEIDWVTIALAVVVVFGGIFLLRIAMARQSGPKSKT